MKDRWVVKLERKIRHHRDMRWKYWKDDVQRDYHDRFRSATEKELEEYKVSSAFRLPAPS